VAQARERLGLLERLLHVVVHLRAEQLLHRHLEAGVPPAEHLAGAAGADLALGRGVDVQALVDDVGPLETQVVLRAGVPYYYLLLLLLAVLLL
jgi:hypothetical protein